MMTAADRFDLERFVTAQAPVFETVLAELRAGSGATGYGSSFLSWPVSDDLRRPGFTASAPSMKRAGIWPPLLGPRLDLCTRIVLASECPSSMRCSARRRSEVSSCMTLFSLAADDPDNPFRRALDRWCGGQPDEQTLR